MLYIASNMNHFILPKIINNLTINDIDVKYTNNTLETQKSASKIVQ